MPEQRTVTLLCSEECLGDLAGALDELEREFGVRIRRLTVSGESKLPNEALAQVDVGVCVFGEDAGPLFRNILSKSAVSLKAVHIGWVGMDAPFFESLRKRGVKLYNSPGVNASGIALNVVAALFMIERRLLHYLDAQRRREWDRLPEAEDPSRRDVAGLTAVLFGFGSIGVETARILRAAGMRIVGVRRSPAEPGDPVDEMVTPDQLVEVAKRADWLINCVPLDEGTKGAVSREVIRALPRGSGFANVGRGGTVDEAALVEALRDGHLRGAYLDVFETEPLPPESPLWDLPNVILTPHNSSGSLGNRARSLQILRRNLATWLREHLAEASQAQGGQQAKL